MTSILVLSDLHVGSTVALCKPSNQLDDGGTYLASAGQHWLYRSWEDMTERVRRNRRGDLYIVVNGDAVEGDLKRRSAQLISRNPATVNAIAADLLDPLARTAQGIFFIRGTAAHVGQSASLEEQLAADLDAVKCPDTGRYSWWHLPLEVDGLLISIAHHPGIGVSKNPAQWFGGIDRLAERVVSTCANQRRRIPDLVIRSHNHTHRDSRDHYRTRAITTPAWTLATEHIHRIEPGAIASIGAILVHVAGSAYEVEDIIYQPAPEAVFTVGG
jgi:hypothetical protein